MIAGRLFRLFVFRLLPLLVIGLPAAHAQAQADPPGRVARLNHAQGSVVFSPAGDNEWTDAALNRPLTRGDRLWTDRGSRAEIQVGSSAVRMDGQTHLEILALDDQSAQLSVTQGTVYVRVRSLPEGENFEVDTPNLAYRAAYPGDYRLDVDAAHGTTRVTIHSGTGAVYGENGQALPLGGGQQVTFRERSLAQVNAQEAPPQDAFDRWALERNRQEDHSISARHVPREVIGYQQLDAHGQWLQDPTYGAVWYPRALPANWAPYRHGHWEWIAPWGWTWIDDAPWGFAPFHYGRWAMIESRWAWVPGWLGLRPVYAPALVAFVGGGSGGVDWSLPLGGGRPGVAWFPLAPGEAWQPGYRASPVYISQANRNITVQANTGYAYQRRPEALTAISAEDFHRGRPAAAGWLRVAANMLTNAQIVPPPPMPEHSGVIAQARAVPSRVAPPPAAEVRQVIAKAAPASAAQRVQPSAPAAPAAATAASARAAAQAQAQAQRQADAHRERLAREEAQRAVQARTSAPQPVPQAVKPAAQAPVAAPAKPAGADPAQARNEAKRDAASARAQQAIARAEQAMARAEQARREKAKSVQAAARQQAERTEQARRDQAAKHAQQSKREQLAKRTEPAKREQQARRAEQARREQAAKREQALREQLARRTEQGRREQQAKRDEQARREAHAQRVEEARKAADRDAQALREQRAQREEQAKRAAEREAQALRAQREEQARREAQRREQAQREAWERQQQALAEQWRRDHQQWEQHQREGTRPRPDLRDDRRGSAPEVWQRGVPILSPGRTS
jgi:hypothetical protein